MYKIVFVRHKTALCKSYSNLKTALRWFKIQIYKQFWILAVFKLQQNFLKDHLPMN